MSLKKSSLQIKITFGEQVVGLVEPVFCETQSIREHPSQFIRTVLLLRAKKWSAVAEDQGSITHMKVLCEKGEKASL